MDIYFQNAKKILKQDKYNYVLVIGRKSGLLASSNSKKEARVKAFNELITRSKNPLNLDNLTIL